MLVGLAFSVGSPNFPGLALGHFSGVTSGVDLAAGMARLFL
jgi:hypothetical protein